MGTVHIWDWKNGMKSSMTHSFPPSNTGSAAARARLPRVSDNAIDWERYIESRKSSVRCKVEHPFRIVKNIFGFRKTIYRGLRKNLN